MTERLTHTHTHRQFKHEENNTRILDLLKNDLVRKTKLDMDQT